jgi:hypothetical protein
LENPNKSNKQIGVGGYGLQKIKITIDETLHIKDIIRTYMSYKNENSIKTGLSFQKLNNFTALISNDKSIGRLRK